jgi:hypothetical protein
MFCLPILARLHQLVQLAQVHDSPDLESLQDDVGAFESFSAADAEGKAPPPKKEEPKDKPEAKEAPKQEAAAKADKQESQQPAPSKPSG